MLSDKRIRKNKEGLGNVLKDARTNEGYTQKALAEALGVEYYTMISQMELGYISIPAALWLPIARTLKMDVEKWVLQCLREYQPEVLEALFGSKSIDNVAKALKLLNRGSLDDLLKD